VQVACTINYDRKRLWKKRQKLFDPKIPSCSFVNLVVDVLEVASRVDYPGAVGENK